VKRVVCSEDMECGSWMGIIFKLFFFFYVFTVNPMKAKKFYIFCWSFVMWHGIWGQYQFFHVFERSVMLTKKK